MRKSGTCGMGLANVAAALVFLLGAGAAQAVPTVDQIGGTALGINNLPIDGTLYNVDFTFGNANDVFGAVINPTFTTFDDAGTASNEINIVLNAEGILRVSGVDARHYGVLYEFEEDGLFDPIVFRGTIFEDQQDWVLLPQVFENTSQTGLTWAVFTVVPEPGTAALLGLGLAGLGVVGRSRRENGEATA